MPQIRTLGRFLRVAQIPRALRRGLGLAVWREGDFLPAVDPRTTARLAEIARAVRGADHPPAIFVHGVLPRSGTNYCANLLALHRDVAAYPRRLYEFPLLFSADGAGALQEELLAAFERNREVMVEHELLGYLASGWLAALQAEAGARRLLFKTPHLQQVGLFTALFPKDRLVICLRDGRDVIASSARTFGRRMLRKSFQQLAAEWRLATEAALAFAPDGPRAHPHVTLVRYEDLVADPEAAARGLLDRLGLDAAGYDFAGLTTLPVVGSSASAATGEERWQPVERAAGFNPVGRWRDWPERRTRQFMRLAGTTLARAGYG